MGKLPRKDGFLLVTVPVNEKYRTEFDNRSGHVRRYTEKDLVKKLENEDFKIIKKKYFDFPLVMVFSRLPSLWFQ